MTQEKMTEKEILSLLDMSEEEQIVWLTFNGILRLESLPDLAFRLRDEVPLENYMSSLNKVRMYRQRQEHALIDAYTLLGMIVAALLAKKKFYNPGELPSHYRNIE